MFQFFLPSILGGPSKGSGDPKFDKWAEIIAVVVVVFILVCLFFGEKVKS